MDGEIDGWMVGWMNVCKWKDRSIDAWMDKWMDGCFGRVDR
jgi:hypothetical protein